MLTMRSEFLGDCTQFPGLAEALNRSQYLIPRLTLDQRQAALAAGFRSRERRRRGVDAVPVSAQATARQAST